MIKKKYRTTPLYEFSERPPLEIREVVKPSSFRLFKIIRLFARTLSQTRFGKASALTKGIAWRNFFENMGGLWVKAGQLVAMRTDLFDEEFTRELSKLQSRVPCFPYANVEEIVEQSMGRKIQDVFSEFDKIPVAAASLAQVHKARLLTNGKLVAVKVQRPYAKEYLNRDLKIIRSSFRFFKKIGIFRSVLLDDMYWELEAMFTEEIDFRYEVVNLREAKVRFEKYGIYVPDVYKRLSSERVVVMEFIEGVTMSDYIAARREDPIRLTMWLNQNKIKPKKVGSFLLRNVWQQVLEDNYFHGDLQPGNIMLLAKNRIAFIDLGSVGVTDEEILSFYRQQWSALGKKNYSKAADFTMLSSADISRENRRNIRQTLVRGIKASLLKASLTDVDTNKKTTFHNTSNDVNRELAKFHVSPNWAMLKLVRAFLTVDPSVINLHPKVDLKVEWMKYYNEAKWRMIEKQIQALVELPKDITDTVSLLSRMLRANAINFKGSISKGMMITTFFMDLIKWLLIGSAVVLILLFIQVCFYPSVQDSGSNWFGRLSRAVPAIPVIYWVAILTGFVLFTRNYIRLVRRLKQPENK